MNKIISYYAIILLYLIVGSGCSTEPSTNNVVEYDSFQKEYQLESEVEEWLDIWNCIDLRIYDSILVAVDWKREKLFHVYNLNSRSLIGQFGRIGQGPDEYFDRPRLNTIYFYEDGELIIQIFDTGRHELHNTNLNKSTSEGNPVYHSEYKMPNFINGKRPFLTNDSILYGADSSVLNVYNHAKEELIKSHEPIKLEQDLPEMYSRIARIMYIEKAPSLDIIVSSFNVQKRLHIYNTNGDLLRVIKESGNHFFDTSEREFYLKNPTHFSSSYLSDELILVLDENRIERNKGGELLLFDYEGNAINKYKLDSYVFIGAVDWKSKTFYAFSYEEGIMISFPLPGIAD